MSTNQINTQNHYADLQRYNKNCPDENLLENRVYFFLKMFVIVMEPSGLVRDISQ